MVFDAEATRRIFVARTKLKDPSSTVRDRPAGHPSRRNSAQHGLDDSALWNVLRVYEPVWSGVPLGAASTYAAPPASVSCPGVTCLWQVRGRNDIDELPAGSLISSTSPTGRCGCLPRSSSPPFPPFSSAAAGR